MKRVFDSHLHIINPKYPLITNAGYLPPDFIVSDYLDRVASLNISSGVVVSASFQAFDQTYLMNALSLLNKTRSEYVGVSQISSDVSDQEIKTLYNNGVRAVRFNLRRGGSASVSELEYMAHRIHELVGWHVELYAGFDALMSLKDTLTRLPSVCIDHLALEKRGHNLLAHLVGRGVKVKATGFGRLDFDPYPCISHLYEINPDSVMFGTDLPSTRADKPFIDKHFYQLLDVLGESAAQKVCWENGRNFYGFS